MHVTLKPFKTYDNEQENHRQIAKPKTPSLRLREPFCEPSDKTGVFIEELK